MRASTGRQGGTRGAPLITHPCDPYHRWKRRRARRPRTREPIADAGPPGLGAFAPTTFVLSALDADLITDKKPAAVTLPLALFHGGLAQLPAGMREFRKGNTFAATAFAPLRLLPAGVRGPREVRRGHPAGLHRASGDRSVPAGLGLCSRCI
ncbi:GPR1/FUN34/YaaH family transporter [Streptomyces sp. NPDC051172]|uniref:GPR1/FUN34/YaaH family transporter n=1 Tax=Streptomyces sp. NPDC051172 TaxID=3155796 RepID=UPI0034431A67